MPRTRLFTPRGEKEYGVLMVDLSTTRDDWNQAIWRMRQLGFGQKGKLALDKKNGRSCLFP